MNFKPLPFAKLSLCLLLMTQASNADDRFVDNWHQWRGPQASGVSRTAKPPISWSEEKNIKWKVAIEGQGNATPIVWKNKVFLLSAINTGRVDPSKPKPEDQPKRVFGIKHPNTFYKFVVLCIDRETGKEIWRKTAREYVPHKGTHHDADFASASPITDGERLFCWFGSAGLFCYDLNGVKLWERDLGKAYVGASLGEGCSPVVFKDKLVIVRDHARQSTIEVLNAKTGMTVWKKERDEPNAWATPRIVDHSGKVQVITAASNKIRSYNLTDGKIIWECGGLTGNVTPCPVVDENNVYCMSGYEGYSLLAIPLSSKGDITGSDQIVWSKKQGTPYVPSPILYDNLLYFTQSNQGILTGVEATSGKTVLERTRLSGISNIYASPVGAEGRIYFVGRRGTTLVIEKGTKLKVLSTNKLDDQFNASPAIAGNQIFLRGRKSLYCIQRSQQEKAEQETNNKSARINWNEEYEKLLRSDPGVRQKVEPGGATREQVIAWLKSFRDDQDKKNAHDKKMKKGNDLKRKSSPDKKGHLFPDTAFEYAKRVEPKLGVPPKVDLSEAVEIPVYVKGRKSKGDFAQCDNPTLLGKLTSSGSMIQRYEGRTAEGKVLPHVVWVAFARRATSDFHGLGSVQMIGYNKKTGATAFFESCDALRPWVKIDPITTRMTGVMPWVDKPREFNKAFRVPGTVQCVQCHQNDPFITDSFINAAKIPGTDESVVPVLDRDSPYYVIGGENWDMRTLHIKGNSCTECHRVGMGTIELFMQNGWDPNKHMPPHDPGSLKEDFQELLDAWKRGPENVANAEWIIPPAKGNPQKTVGEDYPYKASFNRGRGRFSKFDKQDKAVQDSKKKTGKTELKKGNVDWDSEYQNLIKEDPGIRQKVESGAATKEQIIEWLKWRKNDQKNNKNLYRKKPKAKREIEKTSSAAPSKQPQLTQSKSTAKTTPDLQSNPSTRWTRFRGPNGTGISNAKTVPIKWVKKDYNWIIDLPGEGHGSPVVFENSLYVLCGDPESATRILLCINTTNGETTWKKEFPSTKHKLHHSNSFGSGTPVVDERGVVITFADPEKLALVALNHQGETQWERDFGPYDAVNGSGNSPIIVDDQVILTNIQLDANVLVRAGILPQSQADPEPNASSFISVDRHSGKTRWKVERKTFLSSYATPCVRILKNGKKEIVFIESVFGMTGVDAITGKVNWETNRLLPTRTVASPVIAGDLIFGSHGRGVSAEVIVAVRAGGPKTKPKVAYEIKRSAPLTPTPLVKDDLAYLWADNGIVTCIEHATGKVVWRERVRGDYYSSPVWVNGYLYCADRRGNMVVIKGGREFKKVSSNDLGEPSFATPAIANGTMYIRTRSKLFSLGGK